MRRFFQISCIAILFISACSQKAQDCYTGFSIETSHVLMGMDTSFSGSIDFVFSSDAKTAWGRCGEDTIILSDGLVICDYHNSQLQVDTGNFTKFMSSFLLRKQNMYLDPGQAFQYLVDGESVDWFKKNVSFDSIYESSLDQTIFIGGGKNEILGRMSSRIELIYDEKLKRVQKVVLEIEALDMQESERSSAQINQTFSLEKTFIEKKFRDYLVKFFKEGRVSKRKINSKKDTLTFQAPKKFPIIDIINRLPSIGAITIDSPAYYLVIYSYIACGPCKALHKKLIEIQNYLDENRIQILEINKMDSSDAIIREYNKKKFNHLVLYQTQVNKDTTKIEGYPTAFLVNARTEKVVDFLAGMDLKFPLQQWVEEALKKDN